MAPKNAKKAKADAKSKEEPAEKKAKTEAPKEEAAPKAEEAEAVKEEEVEQEADAAADSRPKLSPGAVVFDSAETTINVVPTMGGRILKSLSDGGMQFLIAGARANVGVKGGRYMFEVKILESLFPYEGPGKVPQPKQLVRVGFSTAGSSLILGDGEAGVGFDNEGFFLAAGKRTKSGQRSFSREAVVGVLLNTDPNSPNANTLSLFKDGVRVSKPQPLPEDLKGKPLFPHVSFRNVSLQVHFGPEPLKALPFACRSLQDAAKADVEVAPSSVPSGGKCDVLFPVGLPDEGTFDWLDSFLESNPKYVELSDRMIIKWAGKSGLWSYAGGTSSKDKPGFHFGLKELDNLSVRKTIAAIAPAVPRHYVVMEVKQNLVAAERQEALKQFCPTKFKRVARVVMGKPKPDYAKRVLSKALEDKKKKAEHEWKRKKMEKERKKTIAALAAKKKAAEEAKKKAAEEAKEAKKEEKKEEGEEKPAAEKEEAKEDVKMEEEKVEVAAEDDDEETAPPEVELTEEEKKQVFLPVKVSDLTQAVFDEAFAKFSVPAKSEGFDTVEFEWESEKGCKAYLQKMASAKKVTTKIESLQPGEWFKTKAAEFEKAQGEWQLKKKTVTPPAGKGPEKANVDIFSVVDVSDVGNGEPLFVNFTMTDWELCRIRCELYLLMAGYKKDVDDAERIGIHESNFNFYYRRYFKKTLNPKLYGKNTLAELLELVKDTAKLDSATGVLVSALDEEPETADHFVKVTEDCRRERQRRIDAGDETARLKFDLLIQQQEEAEKKKKQAEEAKLAAAKLAALSTTKTPAKTPAKTPTKVPVPVVPAAGKGGGGKASWGKGSWGKAGGGKAWK